MYAYVRMSAFFCISARPSVCMYACMYMFHVYSCMHLCVYICIRMSTYTDMYVRWYAVCMYYSVCTQCVYVRYTVYKVVSCSGV